MMGKMKVGIIGTGNIGSDLMKKLIRSDVLELTTIIGIDPTSKGMQLAREMGLNILEDGAEGLLDYPYTIDILFDATSAKAHVHNNAIAKRLGIQMIDLTPAAIGPFIVPTVNLKNHLKSENVNLITCGGQATIPIIHAINKVSPIEYGEIVATISSKSAGPGTRANIDEFTETTSKGIEQIGGAKKGKAIIILNPAEPPIMMRDTIYAVVEEGTIDEIAITDSIIEMVMKVQEYVPGYKLRSEPIFEGNRITVFIEVEGAGDYLPKYAGNLDIMTSAAIKVAEEFARNRLNAAINPA
jgi:acetaldehyde dehydrogenase (acetylating)